MQRWVDVHGPAGGLACTTDCKYGYDAMGSRLRITAVRSPLFADHGQGWGGDDPHGYPVTDQGVHEFSLRLHPHDGTWADAHVPRLAEEHALRAPTVIDNGHPGELPREHSLAAVRTGTVMLSALKRSEDGAGTVVRAWEYAGAACDVEIDLSVCGRAWHGRFGPHEVKTIYCPDSPGEPTREVGIPELDI
jgi:alpha-mannosidase